MWKNTIKTLWHQLYRTPYLKVEHQYSALINLNTSIGLQLWLLCTIWMCSINGKPWAPCGCHLCMFESCGIERPNKKRGKIGWIWLYLLTLPLLCTVTTVTVMTTTEGPEFSYTLYLSIRSPFTPPNYPVQLLISIQGTNGSMSFSVDLNGFIGYVFLLKLIYNTIIKAIIKLSDYIYFMLIITCNVTGI